MSDASQALQGHKYINLETFKRNGEGVKTPIWFAHDGDGFVFMTDGRSWKCKRLRRNADCRYAACGVAGAIKGPWFDGTCVKLEGDDVRPAEAILAKKYGLVWTVGSAASGLAGKKKHRAYYRITPKSNQRE